MVRGFGVNHSDGSSEPLKSSIGSSYLMVPVGLYLYDLVLEDAGVS
jgi:hypothetical protein